MEGRPKDDQGHRHPPRGQDLDREHCETHHASQVVFEIVIFIDGTLQYML